MDTLNKRNVIPEWTTPATVMVGYPIREDTWRDGAVPGQKAILQLVQLLLMHTDAIVTLVFNDPIALGLPSNPRLKLLHLPQDDCWMRDISPIFTSENNHVVANCFQFNAWGGANGGCYASFARDQLVARRLAEHYEIEKCNVDMILEGGSVSFDGLGTCLTTAECLLNPNRNPSLTKTHIESIFRLRLGVTKTIWLPYGAAYDTDTDGHVDNMAVFTQPQHVILQYCDAEYNIEQHRRSREALEVLQDASDARGHVLIVHQIPAITLFRKAPETLESSTAKARPVGAISASYVNMLQVNGVVFYPTFDDAKDRLAADALREAFPRGTKMVGVPGREFALAGGGPHCLTCCMPAP